MAEVTIINEKTKFLYMCGYPEHNTQRIKKLLINNANYSMLCPLHAIASFECLLILMEKNNILVKFGDNVRKIRKAKGLSQEQISFKADLHRTYIGMIERAEKNITLSNIEKIANALEVEIAELLK